MILSGKRLLVGSLQWSVRFLRNRTVGGKESSQAGKAEAGLGSGRGSCPFPTQHASQGSNGGFGCCIAPG